MKLASAGAQGKYFGKSDFDPTLQFLVMLALFVAAYFARDLILPIILGFLLAFTLSPLSRGMVRAGFPHAASGAGLAILFVVVGAAGTIVTWSNDFPKMGAEIQEKLRGVSDAVDNMRAVTDEVESLTGADDTEEQVVVSQPGLLASAFDTLTRRGATFAVTLILALFLLSSGDLFYRKLA